MQQPLRTKKTGTTQGLTALSCKSSCSSIPLKRARKNARAPRISKLPKHLCLTKYTWQRMRPNEAQALGHQKIPHNAARLSGAKNGFENKTAWRTQFKRASSRCAELQVAPCSRGSSSACRASIGEFAPTTVGVLLRPASRSRNAELPKNAGQGRAKIGPSGPGNGPDLGTAKRSHFRDRLYQTVQRGAQKGDRLAVPKSGPFLGPLGFHFGAPTGPHESGHGEAATTPKCPSANAP